LNSFLISGNDRTSRRKDKGSSTNVWICYMRPSQMPQSLQAAPLASRSLSRPSLPMDTQVPLWLEAAHPRLYFLSIIVSNLFYSCIVSIVMAALDEARPRLASWFFVQFCKQFNSHDRIIIAWSHLSWFPFCGRTSGCQTTYNCKLMI
jgi:hypothetical protein